MKRHDDLKDLNNQKDDILETTKPVYPSRCLSISLREMEEEEALTLAGQRCKDHLSGTPYWVERANGSNSFWNNLASSAYTIYNEKPASETPPEIIPPSGVPRTIISKKELVELFKIETKKLEIFNRIYLLIKRNELDETGCNWILSVSNGERDDLFKYCEKMQPFTAAMREKYNIPHE